MREKFFNIFILSVAPLANLQPNYVRTIEKSISSTIRKSLAGLAFFLASVSFLYFWVSDFQSKPEWQEWMIYRFTASGIFIIHFFVLKRPLSLMMTRTISASLAISLVALLSYQGSLGYPLRESWLTWPAAISLAVAFVPVIPAFLVLLLTISATYPLWEPNFNFTFIRSDLIFCALILSLGNLIWVILTNSKQEELNNLSLKEQNIQQYISLSDSIKSLISPVLVKRLEVETQNGLEIHNALDTVLQRRKNKVTVLYSDVRNYSRRSHDQSFLENELLPSSSLILDLAETHNGIGRLVGDNVMAYFDEKDPEDSTFLAFITAYQSIIAEHDRISALNRHKQERHFICTLGEALVGNMGSVRHKDPSISGKPINLAARIDELTKDSNLSKILNETPTIVCNEDFAKAIYEIAPFEIYSFNLASHGLEVRSYPEEKHLKLIPLNEQNSKLAEELIKVNKDIL